MKFEHLVQINHPELPASEWLTRQQLWFGLVARAWKPTKFILGLDEAVVAQAEQTANITTLHRKLNYGAFQIEDTVQLHAESHTETTIHPNRFCGPSTLAIRIEEPEEGNLWLRFEYHVVEPEGQSAADSPTADQEEIRKQAYRASDIDTVKMIRELAGAMVPETLTRKDH